MRTPGFFVTFEGPEGAGKSTQVRSLKSWLESHKRPVEATFEPGGSLLGQNMRRWLLKPGHGVSSEAELLLFLADRAQHVSEVMRPALQKGFVVICDRYIDSTVAYQGGGRGYPIPMLNKLNHLATGGLMPDVTFLIDLPVRVGLKRAKKGTLGDRMEQERITFHERVRKTFLEISRRQKKRFIILDGRCSQMALSMRIKAEVLKRLPAELKRGLAETK